MIITSTLLFIYTLGNHRAAKVSSNFSSLLTSSCHLPLSANVVFPSLPRLHLSCCYGRFPLRENHVVSLPIRPVLPSGNHFHCPLLAFNYLPCLPAAQMEDLVFHSISHWLYLRGNRVRGTGNLVKGVTELVATALHTPSPLATPRPNTPGGIHIHDPKPSDRASQGRVILTD